jgi:antitoxin YobK
MSKYLQAVLTRFPNTWVEGGANDEQVRRLEMALACRLPTSYRSFLLSVGAAAGQRDSYISGIIDGDPLSLNGGSLFGDTMRGREEMNLPEGLIVFQWDEEAPYCLDLSREHNGENPVVCYQAHTGTQKTIARDFDEWFDTFFLR